MNTSGETREQPANPDDPVHLSFEHLCLAVTVVAGTVAVGGLAVQATLHYDLLRGAYSILAALIVCGVVGFAAKLVLRELAMVKALLLELRQVLRQLQTQKNPVAPEAEAALQRINLRLLEGGAERN